MQIARTFLGWTVLALFVAQSGYGETNETSSSMVEEGRAIYERSCVTCHGSNGMGNGPAAFYNAAFSASRPQDFTTGNYKLRSTVSGSLPLDQDLLRTITNGIPGAMPSFSGLTVEQRRQVVAYIKTFSPLFTEEQPEVLHYEGPLIPTSAASVKRGRTLYIQMDCHSCHGRQARGDGPVALAEELHDSTGLPIMATDLTHPTGWKNGATAADVVRTLLTGMDGTPMPSYESQFAGHEEDAWHLANYLVSLSRP